MGALKIIAACKQCGVQYDVTGWQPGDSFRCRCGMLITVPGVVVREAHQVRCASCGAVRAQDGDTCAFCGAQFSAADKGWGSMCPNCFCRLPTDANFCVECGLKIDPHDLHWGESDLLCPRCKCALKTRQVENLEMHECGACGGLWLPVAVFEGICQEVESRGISARLVWEARTRHGFEVTDAEQVRYIPCPVCQSLMNRRNFADVSGVIIDTCRDHGIWLDNQELNRIIRFIESGGLKRSQDASERREQYSAALQTLGTPTVRATGDLPLDQGQSAAEKVVWAMTVGAPVALVVVRLLAILLFRR
jgi:Zn-finger nucleic acid-binding protein